MRRLVITLVTAGIIGLPLAAGAFTISPPKYTFIVDPGAKQSGIVTIKNTELTKKTFRLSVLGAHQNANGFPEFGAGLDVAESWVRLEQNSVTLSPGATAPIAFSLAVPARTWPLAHYIGISVEAAAANPAAVGVTGRLVALIYLQVAGTVTEDLRITRFAIQPSALWQEARAANLTLANKGSVPVFVRGRLLVISRAGTELFGRDIAVGRELLPGSERQRTIPFNLESVIRWPGVYSIMAVLEYGRTKQLIRASQTVVFIPLWSLGAAAGLVITGALGWFIVRRARRRISF